MSKQNNLTDFLTDVADAIREKKGTQAPINPQDFSSEIASIPTGGSNPLQDMLDRTSDTNGSSLFSGGSSNIFSQLTYENLIALDFSNKHYTNVSSMFHGCKSLTTIPLLDFSSATDVSSMFMSCSNLITIPQLDFSSAIRANSLFNSCKSLTTIPLLDFSSATNVSSMFADCKSLTAIPQLDFSSATSADSMFAYCTSLTTIPQLDFSSVTNTSFMFQGCTSLTTLDFSNIKSINPSFAKDASSLSTLIIRNSTTLANLTNTSAFSNTPIESGTGYIYVPDNLVNRYKGMTRWSNFEKQIKPLSKLPQGK